MRPACSRRFGLTLQGMTATCTLPTELLERTLRLAYGFDPSEVDVARELDRRRLLCAAAIVCRRWTSAASAVLGQTIIARRLGDFEAVDAAATVGALRLQGVETLVLDETVCRALDVEEAAWAQIEDELGEVVDRTADSMYAAMRGVHHLHSEATLSAFSSQALRLVR